MSQAKPIKEARGLVEQVSQVGVVSERELEALQREVLSINDEWTRVYGDYQSGGWLTLSLMGCTSDPTDTTIRDCDPVETSLLTHMLKTREFLRGLGLRYMWARLARMEPNGSLWEHRDYQELKSVRRLRLHIPVVTNPSATLIIGGRRIHMASGYVWKLNPVHRHGAINFGREPRVHILLDCYANEPLDRMIAAEHLDEKWVRQMPPLAPAELDSFSRTARTLARLGYASAAEHVLLKLFHRYSLAAGEAYDFVCRMYEEVGDEERRQFWSRNKTNFLSRKNDETVHARPALAGK
jgi:hypothetical protein